MQKITEIVVEPSKIFVGSTFKLKIKAIRELTYKELEEKEYSYFESISYKGIEGD